MMSHKKIYVVFRYWGRIGWIEIASHSPDRIVQRQFQLFHGSYKATSPVAMVFQHFGRS